MDSVDLSLEAQLQNDELNGLHFFKGPIELESSNEFILFYHITKTY